MTTDEYRTALNTLTHEQRMELCQATDRQGRAVGNGNVDAMVERLQTKPEVERQAVVWLNQRGFRFETEADKVNRSMHDSADFARRSFSVSMWALVIAVLSAILSLVALVK